MKLLRKRQDILEFSCILTASVVYVVNAFAWDKIESWYAISAEPLAYLFLSSLFLPLFYKLVSHWVQEYPEPLLHKAGYSVFSLIINGIGGVFTTNFLLALALHYSLIKLYPFSGALLIILSTALGLIAGTMMVKKRFALVRRGFIAAGLGHIFLCCLLGAATDYRWGVLSLFALPISLLIGIIVGGIQQRKRNKNYSI